LALNLFVLFLGSVLLFEGLLPLVFPRFWLKFIASVSKYKPGQLRMLGLFLTLSGLLLLLFGIRNL
jgi:uncharacterized protein YjeT (DUF2065 family)